MTVVRPGEQLWLLESSWDPRPGGLPRALFPARHHPDRRRGGVEVSFDFTGRVVNRSLAGAGT